MVDRPLLGEMVFAYCGIEQWAENTKEIRCSIFIGNRTVTEDMNNDYPLFLVFLVELVT